MSAPLVSAQDCCSPCISEPITNIPGPAGADGAAGTNGTNGTNSFSVTSAGYTQPAVAATVSVTVVTSAWAIIGEDAYVQNGGYYLITAIADSTHVTLQNRGYTGNPVAGTVIGAGQRIGPSGVKGLDGVAVGVTLNSISPTTTRGDLIVDNGANSPNAGDVRLGAGTDGQQLTALAAQPTGLIYRTITPNAATDNVVPRFDSSGATTPTPVQSSGLLVTDDGALQSTPTGGNARGSKAVDLQVDRAVVTQVASGANSTVGGGLNNTASGANDTVNGGTTNVASGGNSTIGGGGGNTASALNSTVAGGVSNTASNTRAAIAGGNSNVASGSSSFVGGGDSNTASAQQSSVLGGTTNTASKRLASVIGGGSAAARLFGQVAHASDPFSAAGDAQTSELLWRVTTTDATANVEMFLDGVSATERATVPVNTTWAFFIMGMARRSNGDSITFEVKGGIKNDAGTTILVAAVVASVIADGTAAALTIANFVVDADNANDTLRIRVTGIIAQTWRWLAHGRLVELTH